MTPGHRAIWVDGVAIGGAIFFVGVAFGVLARSNGWSVAQACVMSLTVFTGASQFALVGILGAGGTVAAGVAGALLLASRNAVYGAVVSRWFPEGVMARAAVAQLVIDESTGLGAAQGDSLDQPAPRARIGFLAGGLSVYIGWNLGTLLGAMVGRAVGDVGALGLDAAFPAVFLALLVPHLRARSGLLTAGIAVGIVTLGVSWAPAGLPVLAALIAIVPGTVLRQAEAQ